MMIGYMYVMCMFDDGVNVGFIDHIHAKSLLFNFNKSYQLYITDTCCIVPSYKEPTPAVTHGLE